MWSRWNKLFDIQGKLVHVLPENKGVRLFSSVCHFKQAVPTVQKMSLLYDIVNGELRGKIPVFFLCPWVMKAESQLR